MSFVGINFGGSKKEWDLFKHKVGNVSEHITKYVNMYLDFDDNDHKDVVKIQAEILATEQQKKELNVLLMQKRQKLHILESDNVRKTTEENKQNAECTDYVTDMLTLYKSGDMRLREEFMEAQRQNNTLTLTQFFTMRFKDVAK